MCNFNETTSCMFNGQEIDFKNAEQVQEVLNTIDEVFDNPLLALFTSEDKLNELKNAYRKKIIDAHEEAMNSDEDSMEDDAHYIANAYLEDTVDDWENVPDEVKKRSVKVIVDFFNWLKEKGEDNEE